MRIITRDLRVGDVMATGEIVTHAAKFGTFGCGNKKLSVFLKNPQTGKTRSALWAYYGTLAIQGDDERALKAPVKSAT